MNRIYCISGLAADERIFKNIVIPNTELVHLKWLPFDKEETMSSYAQKMAFQIDETQPILLGLSFGGMLVAEISKLQPIKKGFLVSSAKSPEELPELSSFILFMLQTGLVPYSLFKIPNRVLFEKFGAATSEEQQLLTAILKDTDSKGLGAAFKLIINWKSNLSPKAIVQIHGTHDNIIVPTNIQPDYWIDKGTHMMIWNRSKEIIAILSKELAS